LPGRRITVGVQKYNNVISIFLRIYVTLDLRILYKKYGPMLHKNLRIYVTFNHIFYIKVGY